MEDDFPKDKHDECKEVFDLFDKDRDGTINLKELGDVLRTLGANPTHQELEMIFKETDIDNSGKLEFEEFMELFKNKISFPGLEEDLIEAFRLFDREGSGTVSVTEFKHVMTTLGDALSDEEAEELLRKADIDEKGLINYDEFVKSIVGIATNSI
jgi:calmodulin